MKGIKEELALEGISSCGGEVSIYGKRKRESVSVCVVVLILTWQDDIGVFENELVPDDQEVGAVIVGLDTHVNYRKYAKAFAYLTRNPGCYFLLTNEDSTFPQHGSFYPGKNKNFYQPPLPKKIDIFF